MGIDQLTLCPPPPAWLAVIFLQKRSGILQGKCKKKTVLELSATTTTTMVIYIFITPQVTISFQNHRRLAKEAKYVPGQNSQTAESH